MLVSLVVRGVSSQNTASPFVRFKPVVESLEARELLSAPPTTFSQRGTGGGGALYSPSINPANNNEIYIASDMSNLFRTTNGGSFWNTVSASQIQGNHYAKVQFTNDPLIRYALDYANVNGLDLKRPSKSTDGGTTWIPLAGDPTGSDAFYVFANPNNANQVIVTDYTRFYFSNNGGTSFTQKYSTSDTNTGLHLGGVFWEGNNIYVGTNKGLLVSSDGGSSFNISSVSGIPVGQSFLSLAGAKQGTVTRLFAVVGTAANIYAGITGADYGIYTGVYTLDVGQGNWLAKTSGINSGSFLFFVDMAQDNINLAYLGGTNNGAPMVFKTTNGGTSWSSVFITANNQNIQTGWQGQGGDRGWGYGEYALGFTVARNDPNKVMFTDLGGAHQSTDGGSTWKALYVSPSYLNPANAPTPQGKPYRSSGLDNTTGWQVYWSDLFNMFSANSDIRGMRSVNGGQEWSFNYTGHTDNSMYRMVKNNSNSTIYAATSTIHDMYQTTRLRDNPLNSGTGKVLFSTNQGATWQTMHSFSSGAEAGGVVWVATDPTNNNRLYASVVHSTNGGIYVTNNAQLGAASTWTKLANPPRTEGHPFNIVVLNDGTIVVSYSARINSSGSFTASSGIFVSTNGGSSWVDRSDSNMVYYTKDIVVDPHDATQNTWYACVWSGWGGPPNGKGGLYRTTNRGQSWTKINSLDRVSSITISPTEPNDAYLTTETQGLWKTQNLNAATPLFSKVTNFPFRQPERVFFNPFAPTELWVTTFGGGLWTGTIDDTPPIFRLSSVNYDVNESAGSVLITVQRIGNTFGLDTVDYTTMDVGDPGTAVSGQDYIATSGTLVFNPNDTQKTFSVTIINDSIVEGTEYFLVILTGSSQGSTFKFPKKAAVNILDDDGAAVPPWNGDGGSGRLPPWFFMSQDGSSSQHPEPASITSSDHSGNRGPTQSITWKHFATSSFDAQHNKFTKDRYVTDRHFTRLHQMTSAIWEHPLVDRWFKSLWVDIEAG